MLAVPYAKIAAASTTQKPELQNPITSRGITKLKLYAHVAYVMCCTTAEDKSTRLRSTEEFKMEQLATETVCMLIHVGSHFTNW